MDLINTLKRKVAALEEGEYLNGLKAVLLHIETSFQHLNRGQDTGEETAFTDAIYRCNQAFEGSVKEAFRVLAGKDPSKMTPFDIETYLERKSIFRPRVLGQLTTYRTEWRNPSTHDYKLDFDESEAFLAIVSVTAFACLLLDQISERLSFNGTQAAAELKKGSFSPKIGKSTNGGLQSRVSQILLTFCATPFPYNTGDVIPSEAQVIGAIHGFISSVAPDITVISDVIVDGTSRSRVDFLISLGDERLMVEVKGPRFRGASDNLVVQVAHYMNLGGTKAGIAIVVPKFPQIMHVEEHEIGRAGEKVIVIRPQDCSRNT